MYTHDDPIDGIDILLGKEVTLKVNLVEMPIWTQVAVLRQNGFLKSPFGDAQNELCRVK